jgi:Tol biopolymer transport system component
LVIPNVERWGAPPGTDLKLLRLMGAFPAFSPDGKRLALVGDLSRLDQMKTDGSGRETIFAGRYRGLFSTSWAHQDERIAFAVGGVFEGTGAEVDLMTVRPDGSGLRQLTRQTGNNVFPSFSPDGKQLIFRSGRSSNKNLYLYK